MFFGGYLFFSCKRPKFWHPWKSFSRVVHTCTISVYKSKKILFTFFFYFNQGILILFLKTFFENIFSI